MPDRITNTEDVIDSRDVLARIEQLQAIRQPGPVPEGVLERDSVSYGWIIDVDHMPDKSAPEGTNLNAKGLIGPYDIPEWMENALLTATVPAWAIVQGVAIYQFNIYDDDSELYYSGRMITDDPSGEACAGPLNDFGTPNAGATEIRYVNHPEMDI